jgi:glycosyltransferase involved in cell wall biosynthesis
VLGEKPNSKLDKNMASRAKNMKVCIISPHYPSDDAIGEYCGHLAAMLCRTTDVAVLANKGKGLPKTARVHPKGEQSSYVVYRVWKPGLFYPFTVFKNIIRQKPDIVHIQHEYFLYGKGYNAVLFPIIPLLVKIAAIPQVITMHHVIPLKETTHFQKLLGSSIPETPLKALLTLFSRFFSLSSRIMVPSTAFKETLSMDYKIDKAKIAIVPHFTDIKVREILKEDSTTAKSKLSLSGKKVVLFFGYIRPQKGVEYVLYALPKVIENVPKTIFSIVGKAQDNYVTYFKYLKQVVNELNLTEYVRFEDHVPEENLPVTFAASDAVVFPYVSTMGTTPIAHLKAASYGKPIIASNIDEFHAEFVDHENALLVQPRDPDAISKSIIEIFTDDDLSKKLSKNILHYCDKRPQERVIREISSIYQDVLQKNRKRKGSTKE